MKIGFCLFFYVIAFINPVHLFAADVGVRYSLGSDVVAVPVTAPVKELNVGRIYLSNLSAVDIQKIICDGVELNQKKFEADIYEEAPYEVSPNSDIYVYILPVRQRLIYSKAINPDGSPKEMMFFLIPNFWSRLRIFYKIRFPNGAVSPGYEADFSRLTAEEAMKGQNDQKERLDRSQKKEAAR